MVKLFVEGGGTSNALRTECRQAFTNFITEAGLTKRPRVVACGSRQDAYDDYCTAIKNNEAAMLLVDSEAAVNNSHQSGKAETWQPWQHLKARQGDGWDKPAGVDDTDCHLMVQCMESWFLADRATLKSFFGQGYTENPLPATGNPIESIAKTSVFSGLANATRQSQSKGQYGKGNHSFKLLAEIDPEKVLSASPWAKRFIDQLKKKMGE